MATFTRFPCFRRMPSLCVDSVTGKIEYPGNFICRFFVELHIGVTITCVLRLAKNGKPITRETSNFIFSKMYHVCVI